MRDELDSEEDLSNIRRQEVARYNNLIAEHARLTLQVVHLEKTGETHVRDENRIQRVEDERKRVHRELEEIGRNSGRSTVSVQMDVLAYQYNLPELGIPGLHAIPMVTHDLSDLLGLDVAFSSDFQQNPFFNQYLSRNEEAVPFVVLAYDESFDTKEDEGYGFGNEEKFSQWLEPRATALQESLVRQFRDERIKRVDIDNHGRMMSHAGMRRVKGIAIPSYLLETLVSWIKKHPESWVTPKEYRERQTTYVRWDNFGSESYGRYRDLPGSLSEDMRHRLNTLKVRFASTYDDLQTRENDAKEWGDRIETFGTGHLAGEPELIACVAGKNKNSLEVTTRVSGETLRIQFFTNRHENAEARTFSTVEDAERFLERERERANAWLDGIELTWEGEDVRGVTDTLGPYSIHVRYDQGKPLRLPLTLPTDQRARLERTFGELQSVRNGHFGQPFKGKPLPKNKTPLLSAAELRFTLHRQNGKWFGSVRDAGDHGHGRAETMDELPLEEFVERVEESVRWMKDWVGEAVLGTAEERREFEGLETERKLAARRPIRR